MTETNRFTRPLVAAIVASVWLLASGSARGGERPPGPTAPSATEEGFLDEVQEERDEHAQDAAKAMEKKNEENKAPEDAPAAPPRR